MVHRGWLYRQISGLLALNLTATFTEERFNRFSSFSKLRRSIAYCMRYLRIHRNCKQQAKMEPLEALTTTDLRDADITICRLMQREMFL